MDLRITRLSSIVKKVVEKFKQVLKEKAVKAQRIIYDLLNMDLDF